MITSQLKIEDITDIPAEYHRLIMFDPEPIYEILYNHQPRFERQTFSHYKRLNTVEMSIIFPNEKGICACGCGHKLKGRSTRWLDRSHTDLALTIQCILAGRSESIRPIIEAVYGSNCSECGTDNDEAYEKYYRKDTFSLVSQFIELDHIIPVHQGGGGCWLGNYQLICRGCHKEKSKTERSFK